VIPNRNGAVGSRLFLSSLNCIYLLLLLFFCLTYAANDVSCEDIKNGLGVTRVYREWSYIYGVLKVLLSIILLLCSVPVGTSLVHAIRLEGPRDWHQCDSSRQGLTCHKFLQLWGRTYTYCCHIMYLFLCEEIVFCVSPLLDFSQMQISRRYV
jgi:hypothetical protein